MTAPIARSQNLSPVISVWPASSARGNNKFSWEVLGTRDRSREGRTSAEHDLVHEEPERDGRDGVVPCDSVVSWVANAEERKGTHTWR